MFLNFFGSLRLFMITTNIFVIANVNKLRTGCRFTISLSFLPKILGFGVLSSAIFISFHNRVQFGTILKGLQNFGVGL